MIWPYDAALPLSSLAYADTGSAVSTAFHDDIGFLSLFIMRINGSFQIARDGQIWRLREARSGSESHNEREGKEMEFIPAFEKGGKKSEKRKLAVIFLYRRDNQLNLVHKLGLIVRVL